jgi:hypothetical protein
MLVGLTMLLATILIKNLKMPSTKCKQWGIYEETKNGMTNVNEFVREWDIAHDDN